jgi:plasmid stabilization system protein ParE
MEIKVVLTIKEQHKLKMVIDYEAKKIIARNAADLPGIFVRHFRRLAAAYRERGVVALAHGNRGKFSLGKHAIIIPRLSHLLIRI